MLFTETVSVLSTNHMKHKYTMRTDCSLSMLKQVVQTVTAGLQIINPH
jgi:hypothetical protein